MWSIFWPPKLIRERIELQGDMMGIMFPSELDAEIWLTRYDPPRAPKLK